MKQAKKHSLIESITNVAVGYFVALGSQIVIFPFFNIHIPFSDNLIIGLWFTCISIARSYLLRRIFTNHISKKKKSRIYGLGWTALKKRVERIKGKKTLDKK